MSDRLGHATTAFTMDVYTSTGDELMRDATSRIANESFELPHSGEAPPVESD